MPSDSTMTRIAPQSITRNTIISAKSQLIGGTVSIDRFSGGLYAFGMNDFRVFRLVKSYLLIAVWCGLIVAAIGRTQQVSADSVVVGDGTLRRIHVPILMYHYVSSLPPDADDIRRDLTVEPDSFRAHMQYLRDDGYHTISLYQLHDALMFGTPLPPKSVILTFDDGYIDHFVTVLPILQEMGFVGTFFIITGRADANDPAYVSWTHIKAMADSGMSMEPHTKSHLDLRGRDHDFLVYELLGSFESLSAHIGRESRMFCYPGGRYDDATLQLAQEMDIWRAVTTQPGMDHTTDNRLELPRVRVSGGTGPGGLAYLLGGD
jgi:peptidoglycan/xylan/chitin deacetylase (PgdA/CDA1 family)